MSLAAARRVADAVLYEGYLLYPYRSTAAKNRIRWQFGVLGPPGAAAAGTGEPSGLSAEVLLRNDGQPVLDVTVRFLQVQAREVERLDGDGYLPTDRLVADGAAWVAWHEAVEREVAFPGLPLAALGAAGRSLEIAVGGGRDVEELPGDRRPVGRLVRTRWPLRARLEVSAATTPAGTVVRLELSNVTAYTPAEDGWASPRDVAARASLVGTHLLLDVQGGAFCSSTDAAASGLRTARCWPVLVGDGDHDVVLVSPIILDDHPAIAAESPGELYDSTEIDEILTLRVMTLTEEEKSAARGTDPRAAAIIDRCDTMAPEVFERLHGALRTFDTRTSDGADVPWWDPSADASVEPERDTVLVGDTPVGKGSRVVLRPSRRADVQDLFLAGQVGRVTGVFFDVDGSTHVAVVLEDDPASDLHEAYGRFYYFAPDELEPLAAPAAAEATP